VAGTEPVPVGGGTLTFRLDGGTETDYTVTTDVGSLTNAAGDRDQTIDVNIEDPFILEVPANVGDAEITITLTATDQVNGQQRTRTVTQSGP
jgi:hypothetical protein